MSPHPFRLAYIGLGLLDAASIRRDGATWTAGYPDAEGRPYLRVRIDPDGVTLTEFDEDGAPVATTREPALSRAIGVHGRGALEGRTSRLLMRLAPRVRNAWFPLDTDVQYSFVPAIALATLRVPLALDARWQTPEPGPLARRLGFAFDEDSESPVTACLWRWLEGNAAPRPELIIVRHLTVPVILAPELAAAVEVANGFVRMVEWRPFFGVDCATRMTQRWTSPPQLPDRPDPAILRYEISEEGAAPVNPRRCSRRPTSHSASRMS